MENLSKGNRHILVIGMAMALFMAIIGDSNRAQNERIEALEKKYAEVMELEKFRQDVDEVIVNRMAGMSNQRFDSLLVQHRNDRARAAIVAEIQKLRDSLLTERDTAAQKVITHKIAALESRFVALNKKR